MQVFQKKKEDLILVYNSVISKGYGRSLPIKQLNKKRDKEMGDGMSDYFDAVMLFDFDYMDISDVAV